VHFQVQLFPDGSIKLLYLDVAPGYHIHAPVSIGIGGGDGSTGMQIEFGEDLREVKQEVFISPACHAVEDCAGVLAGGLVPDACGVCGGDGASCKGCTDPEATNHATAATVEDGSCVYTCEPVPLLPDITLFAVGGVDASREAIPTLHARASEHP
jgi:hypothetical protein